MPFQNNTVRFVRGLYGLTPEWRDFNRLQSAVFDAHQGGMQALQWRRKDLDGLEQRRAARAMAQWCRTLGLVFIVNDDWRLAAEVDADGVHLGRDDGSVADARRALGAGKIIGYSCYNDPARARLAMDAGADYVAFGAVYPSPSKPDAVRASLSHIAAGRKIAASYAHPRPAVVAIGGITPANAAPVAAAGADSVALIQGLFEAPDIAAAARACANLYD